MRQRRQESSRKISEQFYAFFTQCQNTPVRIEGRVIKRHLPEHPVQGNMLITWKSGRSETVTVEDGHYFWQGLAYLLWDVVEGDWETLEFQFQRTEGSLLVLHRVTSDRREAVSRV